MENNRPVIGIGIDTGGTFTDGVVYDFSTSEVICTTKKQTTHHDLSIGINNVLTELLEQARTTPDNIEGIAVSTTLATNTIVEGKGAEVALFVIGHVKPFTLPQGTVQFIGGGHNHKGEEEQPLEMEGLLDGIKDVQPFAEAYAVSSVMSIKNPTHEKVAEKAIKLIDPNKPVFCSHLISKRPGVKERAATAVLNARLMPVMQSFFESMQRSLEKDHYTDKIYIIRGDCTPMPFADAIEQAATTVASGPAATVSFGKAFSPSDTAVIVDVGGTTTDITMIKDGAPTYDTEGNLIGDWHTHVDAVAMSTRGTGGDSHVDYNESGHVTVGPSRVIPLAMAAEVAPPQTWLSKGMRSKWLIPAANLSPDLVERDNILNILVKKGPMTPADLRSHLDMAEGSINNHLEELVRKQYIDVVGFTPTDALHVLGKIKLGNTEIASQGATVFASQLGVTVEEFCRQILLNTEQQIEDAIIDHILRHETGKSISSFFPHYRTSEIVGLHFTLNVPIVGIGAAAQYLLPGVAERLRTEVVFPKHYEVGNALGAILIAAEELTNCIH